MATARGPAVTPTAGATPTPSADTDEAKALRYTRCMTAHGSVHPDPVVGELLVTVNLLQPGEPAGALPARIAAHEQCKQFLPATWPIRVDPAAIARDHAFAACMAAHGVPLPTPDANNMIQYPTGSQPVDPAYDPAIAACRHLVDDPANDLPENR